MLSAPAPGAADRFRALLSGDAPVHLPGVYDAVTAHLAVANGARGVCLSGASVSAVDLGLPDLGFVHGTDIVRRASSLLPPLGDVPLMADADTGYGNALQARHTTLTYAAAGIAALHLEDQVSPKRCGHMAGKDVIELAEAAARVRAAVDSGADLVVVARTDALSVRGAQEVVARAVAFAEAGAEAIFPEGAGIDVLEQVSAALDAAGHRLPLVWNCSEAAGAVEKFPTAEQLGQVGVRAIIHPVSALLAAARAAGDVYAAISAQGTAAGTERLEWADLTGLVGLPPMLEIENEYATVTETPSGASKGA